EIKPNPTKSHHQALSSLHQALGISWDNWHRISTIEGKRNLYHEKQKDVLRQAAANTNRGGNKKSGQCSRAEGFVLEGEEIEFYLRMVKACNKSSSTA
ncbi:hypothetical protein A6R68_21998, partial [Neotoma lepida]